MPMLRARGLKARCEDVLKCVSCDKCERKNNPDEELCAHCEVKLCNDTIAIIDAYDRKISELQREKQEMCVKCTWKQQAMDIKKIPDGKGSGCFHGEVWYRCPHCDKGNEMHGMKPFVEQDGCTVYLCRECGKMFKIRM